MKMYSSRGVRHFVANDWVRRFERSSEQAVRTRCTVRGTHQRTRRQAARVLGPWLSRRDHAERLARSGGGMTSRSDLKLVFIDCRRSPAAACIACTVTRTRRFHHPLKPAKQQRHMEMHSSAAPLLYIRVRSPPRALLLFTPPGRRRRPMSNARRQGPEDENSDSPSRIWTENCNPSPCNIPTAGRSNNPRTRD